jgi:UDP-N-acetylmuramoyl-L-alanyl-D-glutamate--2,6-diaminopimelate ligase
LIVLFGCGGDRDKSKRGPMGQIAYNYADKVFITSDNPRTENPQVILDEICTGISTNKTNKDEFAKKVIVQENRALAIAQAIQMTRPEDVLIIAGKGHETYQIIGQTRLPFDDYQVAKKALEEI